MVNISIFKGHNLITGFRIKGHAGFAKSGKDIVCAAVSAIAYTAIGSIEEYGVGGEYKDKDGYMVYHMPEHVYEIHNDDNLKRKLEDTQLILNSFVLGLKQIEESYGKYLVIHEEV